MDFTEGRHRKYERLMKEKPGFDRGMPKDEPERPCPHRNGRRETNTERRLKKKNKE
ncbi:hypothetical protein [Ferviditalea candida]|uniref:Uncharacterized protein n=1 Tax=Ferviditalea candida TaxID=3108399 RepID=A0ABU5ZNE5_9BACL|nr:hypothetical protein [Paenibacillaceae bacterium T2]